MTFDDLPFEWPSPATVNVTTRRAKGEPDAVRQRRNRNNRARGKRTSHELADYLGGQDVETLGWSWDVQGDGYRIQSKRLADRPSLAAIVAILEAIAYTTNHLRAFYHVEPRRRLESGHVWFGLKEWIEWHGWDLPAGSSVDVVRGSALIAMPLPLFRDIHVNGGKK